MNSFNAEQGKSGKFLRITFEKYTDNNEPIKNLTQITQRIE